MPTEQPNEDDLLIESTVVKRIERPKKLQSLVDTQAMRFLEAMDFQSFNNLSGAFEKFMMEAPLFQGDASFANAAIALDLTAKLFPLIDTDKNHLLSREEFAYLLLKTNAENRQALAWLTENFNAFTQACFFKDQIGKDDIEAARNVFHGLKIANEKFGFKKEPTLENLQDLDANQIKDFLAANKSSLSPHEAAGLTYLLDHIKKNVSPKDAPKAKNAEKLNDNFESKKLEQLGGVLDRRSLKTLQSLRLNSFESLFAAFISCLEDGLSFKGDTPFSKSANALDTTSRLLTDLDMGEDHMFTRDELLIVSKLSTDKDKKHLGWFAKHFDAFNKAFFFPGKAKKKDVASARNVFQALGLVQERFYYDQNAPLLSQSEIEKQIKDYMRSLNEALETQKRSLEQLLLFMEKHAK